MKKLLLLACIAAWVFAERDVFAVVDYQCTPTSGISSYSGSYGGATVNIVGVYPTEADAAAAAAAYVGPAGTNGLPACTATQGGYAYNAGIISSGWNDSKGRWERYNHSTFGCGPQDGTKVVLAFIYPSNPSSGICAALPPDTDGDGLRDDVDPYPDDPSEMSFKIIAYQESNGVKTWVRIRMSNGDVFEYGTRDPNGVDWYNVGGEWLGNDDFASLFPGLSRTPGERVEIGPGTDPDMSAGEDNTGNTVEVDYLADVVTNTKRALDNQAAQQDVLREISEGIKNQTKILSGNPGGGVVGGGGLNSGGVATGVGDALDERGTTAGDFSAIDPSFSGALGTGDVPEKGSLTTTLEGAQNWGGSIKTYLLGSRVVGSGACSFQWVYKGKSATFGVCQWSDQLALMGTLLLAIAGAYSLMIVLGRA